MKDLDRFIDSEKAAEVIRMMGDEFAVVKNPSYIHPAIELYPLAEKITGPVSKLKAAVMDMDGTTTTTEALCIHSLEYMVRKITGRMSEEEWRGLDRRKDYPNIIGNSTTKHVEYLITSYQNTIDQKALCINYLRSAIWTLVHSRDSGRLGDVTSNLLNLGSKDMLKRIPVDELKDLKEKDPNKYEKMAHRVAGSYVNQIRIHSHTDRVRAGIDIYYHRYHEILSKIQEGKGEVLAEELLGEPGKHLIEPMKGIGVFIALIKGWLGEEIINLLSGLKNELMEIQPDTEVPDENSLEIDLKKIGVRFEQNPAKVAVVTSSILYEAEIVMSEVFRVLHSEIEAWPVSETRKRMLLDKFSSLENIYDNFGLI
jgi:hypothetical protein